MNSYDFAKLVDGKICHAPNKLDLENYIVYNPSAEAYIASGYKPVKFTASPEAPEGYYYESGWEDQETAIVQKWTLREIPEEPPNAEELLNIIIGGES